MSACGDACRLAAVVVLACVIGLQSRVTHAQAPPPGHGPITVNGFVRVIEADTFEVRVEGRRVGVRIVGIRVAPGNTECGLRAMNVLQGLVECGIVLEDDPLVPTFDAQKLRLYRVTRNSVSVAVELAHAGFAESDQRGTDRDLIVAAAAEARASRRGCVR